VDGGRVLVGKGEVGEIYGGMEDLPKVFHVASILTWFEFVKFLL
jgi:hypothetical protein